MGARNITRTGQASSCYFRTTACRAPGRPKGWSGLLQHRSTSNAIGRERLSQAANGVARQGVLAVFGPTGLGIELLVVGRRGRFVKSSNPATLEFSHRIANLGVEQVERPQASVRRLGD